MRRHHILAFSLAAMLMGAAARQAAAQNVRGLVVDQTGLPLPGVAVQLMDGAVVVTALFTDGEGAFEFDAGLKGDEITASLQGFETARVARTTNLRIVLAIARAVESTTVVAPVLPSSSPTASDVGTGLSANTVARLPSARLKARESLPLLPSMVRGADGLLRLGGARPYETPLLLDGFNVTDPATGTSNINLPFEAVEGVEVLRDPISVTYGGLLGGLVQLTSRPGGDHFGFGVQGFVPRPRFANPGFGRLEGIFPRVYFNGAMFGHRVHYSTAVEYDFERIAVPDVTQGKGPNLVEESATFFGRIDVQAHPRYNLTVESLAFPSRNRSVGLSIRREQPATANISQRDLFAGLTNRIVLGNASTLLIRVGAFAHNTTLSPNGFGASRLSPLAWRTNWFATEERHATRYSFAASWDRALMVASRGHALTVSARLASRRLDGTVAENPIGVEDEAGRLVRRIEFGAPGQLRASDAIAELAVRDVLDVTDRVQIDVGARVDHNRAYGRAIPSARAGLRYDLDEAGLTVLRLGAGTFIGNLPLIVRAFAGQPTRTDTDVDPATGADIRSVVLQPAVEQLRLPRAMSGTIQIERQLRPGFDAQIGATARNSTHLATLDVPVSSGPAVVRSTGTGTYREIQVSVRKRWEHDQQLFISYVRSSARGEVNDFAALFQSIDTPLLQPGDRSRLAADAPNRWIMWGTFNLPRRVVVSPVVEWHSGFPYSVVDQRYRYTGQPNGASFPAFMAADFVVFKTFTVHRRSADFGMQLFNATSHFNPRDVYPVAGSARFGTFTDSVGTIVRGFMMLKW